MTTAPLPKSLEEFIAKYDSLLGCWIRGYGFFGAEYDDAKQDIYTNFLRKGVVEGFNPAIIKNGDFLSYIRFKVNRLLSTFYRRKKKLMTTQGMVYVVDGEEVPLELPDSKYVRHDELGRWWEDHVSLLSDPEVYRPIVIKRVGRKYVIVTPMLVINMVLLGFSAEDVLESLRLSRYCFNQIRIIIQEKLGPAMFWSDGGE